MLYFLVLGFVSSSSACNISVTGYTGTHLAESTWWTQQKSRAKHSYCGHMKPQIPMKFEVIGRLIHWLASVSMYVCARNFLIETNYHSLQLFANKPNDVFAKHFACEIDSILSCGSGQTVEYGDCHNFIYLLIGSRAHAPFGFFKWNNARERKGKREEEGNVNMFNIFVVRPHCWYGNMSWSSTFSLNSCFQQKRTPATEHPCVVIRLSIVTLYNTTSININ